MKINLTWDTVTGTLVPVDNLQVVTSGVTTVPTTTPTPVTNSGVSTPPVTSSGVSTPVNTPTSTTPSTPTGTTTASASSYYIWKNGVQNSWRDYSFTGTYSTDATGDKVGVIGAYGAISFNSLNNANVLSQNYLGLQFDIKSDGKQNVSVALYSSQTQVANKVITPTSALQTVTLLWSDFGLTPGATFTNVLFQNLGGTALVDPVVVNNVALLVNPNPSPVPVPLPVLDPSPAPANTNNVPWLSVKGNKIVDSTGTPWMGRGCNVFDNYLDGSGVGTAPATGAAEAIRRIQFAYNAGCDYFRLLLQAFDSSGHETSAGQLMNNPAYLAAVKSIVEFVGTLPGARVEVTVDIDASLSPPIGGQPTLGTTAVLTQLVYSLYNCSHVLFGCCNEPSGNSATSSRTALLSVFNACVAAVRTAEAKVGSKTHLVVVQGVDNYAREVLWYVTNPVTDSANAVVYEAHIYDPNGDQWWNEYVQAAATLPLVCGEFGPATTGTVMSQADSLVWQAELEKLGTPYTFWACDQSAAPAALVNNAPGGSGIGMVLNWNAWGLAVVNALRASKKLAAIKADNSAA
jgi:Cellulase (glycosyl hydrolase family 5)